MKNILYRIIPGICLLSVLAVGCFGGTRASSGWSGVHAEGGSVYFASSMGKVYCLDGTTGTQKWAFPAAEKETKGPYYARPVVADGLLLAGSGTDRENKNVLYAIEASSGIPRWSFAVGGPIVAEVAASEDKVYVSSSDRKLYALKLADGSKLWEYESGNWIWAMPLVVGQDVYLASMDHKIHRLHAETGRKVWERDIGAAIPSAPVYAGGLVIFGALDSRIRALDAEDGSLKWEFKAQPRETVGLTLETGRWFWGQPIVVDNTLYVGSLDQRLYALDVTTGTKRWDMAMAGPVVAGPSVAAGVLYVGTDTGTLHAVDINTRQGKWAFHAESSILGKPAISDGMVFVGTTKGVLIALDAGTGTERWRFPQK